MTNKELDLRFRKECAADLESATFDEQLMIRWNGIYDQKLRGNISNATFVFLYKVYARRKYYLQHLSTRAVARLTLPDTELL